MNQKAILLKSKKNKIDESFNRLPKILFTDFFNIVKLLNDRKLCKNYI